MNRKECIIFKENNFHKIKIKEIFKMVERNNKNNEIFFMHIESHGNTYLALIDEDSPYNDEIIEILSKEELTNGNFVEKEDRLTFLHIFNSLEFCNKTFIIKKYEKEEILEVYDNLEYKLITNMFSYFAPNKFLINIKDEEFKEISVEELNEGFNKILNKIYE